MQPLQTLHDSRATRIDVDILCLSIYLSNLSYHDLSICLILVPAHMALTKSWFPLGPPALHPGRVRKCTNLRSGLWRSWLGREIPEHSGWESQQISNECPFAMFDYQKVSTNIPFISHWYCMNIKLDSHETTMFVDQIHCFGVNPSRFHGNSPLQYRWNTRRVSLGSTSQKLQPGPSYVDALPKGH